MGLFLVLLLMALSWVVLTGIFSGINFLIGMAIGYFSLWLIREQIGIFGALERTRRILSLFAIFIYEIFVSAIRVAIIVIKPNMNIKPAIIEYELRVSSGFAITLLANMITLTPGTLSVDVSGDNSVLYIHVIDIDDPERLKKDIARGFERMIMEAFS